MGLRTLVLAFVLLALVAYVSSAPFPSDSSESRSRDVSDSQEDSKSLHSDESASASVEKHDDHPETGHKHRRDVTSSTAAPTIGHAQSTTGAHNSMASSTAATASAITATASPVSSSTPTEGKLQLDVQEFYPVQSLFP